MSATVQDNALEVLRHVFGYSAFRGKQAQIIEQVASGGDALVLMPTGGGKSLCYQIPALLRPGCGVVVSPLIALMQDQVAALRQAGVEAAFLNSTLSAAEAAEVERSLRDGTLKLLYVAPERLVNPRCLGLLASSEIALFAIDEAHCVSQWGHDFRPEYIQLSVLAEQFPNVPRIALTATADQQTREEIAERLQLKAAPVFLSSFDRPNIRYTVVEKDNPRKQLLHFLRNNHVGASGIVYCLSRKKVDETAKWLKEQGIKALPYHAGMDSDSRAQHQSRFLREDGLVMVATVAFGMGIDKPDVRFVAHLDLPKSLEGYYQETGRAGRDGLPSDAWMVYGLQDVVLLREMIEQSTAPDEIKRIERQKLDSMLGYCEAPQCRRQILLNYFGEASQPCRNCDICLNPPERWDASVSVQKALSTIYRSGQRYGATHLIDILLGKSTPKIRECGHDHLSTYGIGKDLSEQQWRSALRQLVATGIVDVNAHGGLQLTDACRPILRGEQAVQLRRVIEQPKTAGSSSKTPLSFDNDADRELWAALRQCRRRLAEDQNVPAYVIFADATLQQMLEKRPQSLEALRDISGVGDRKLELYGTEFLAVLRQG
ncbi:MAG: DNA helicase RecQ [Chitinivorax sp.]